MLRLVLNLEIAQAAPQSASARYVLALAKQLCVGVPGNAEVILVLSGAFPSAIERLRGEFLNLLPQNQIRIWQPPMDISSSSQGGDGMRWVANRMHQAFIAEMQPDLTVLSSLLHGLQGFSVMSQECVSYGSAVAVFLPTQAEIGKSENVHIHWGQQRLDRFDRGGYLLEVPGLTALAEDLRLSDDLRRVRLAEWVPSECLDSASSDLIWELVKQEHALQVKQWVPKRENPRLRLAYVSPLPPEPTGIGYYSAELLPELASYYDIDVVVNQSYVEDEWIHSHCGIRSVAWFERHGHEYDRVVYQFGNSRFHAHMWHLIEKIPGIAVVHDFFLGDAVAYREDVGGVGLALPLELYSAHGYAALKPLLLGRGRSEAIQQFPCSYSPIREAKGVIIHSQHAHDLAAKWYGEEVAKRIHVIPHLRNLPEIGPKLRSQARERLGIEQGVFLVCSFGIVNKTKLSHRLFSAWQNVHLRKDPNARLVFVGETLNEYSSSLRREVEASEFGNRVSFTGWASSSIFQDYLAAADVAVQLRTDSRGETSGTVLDCMAHGVATICNAHGSFAEVPDQGVWKLDDRFTDDALVDAMDTLWREADRRKALGYSARQQIERHYSPAFCSERYFQAIEQAYNTPSRRRLDVVKTAVGVLNRDELNEHVAACIGSTLPVRSPQRQLLVDVSVVVREDLRTGVQRVVRSILNQLLESDLSGFRIEPIYCSPRTNGYLYARGFTQHFMGGNLSILPDDPLEADCGDIFLGLDLHANGIQTQRGYLERLRDKGVKVFFVVYDLLPITHPHWFPAIEERAFEGWLHCITRFDGAICISETTANELRKWMTSRNIQRHRPFEVKVAHIGADIRQSVPTMGLPDEAEEVLAKLRNKPSFLMVGTIEPRKGVAQVLSAFELLWKRGRDFNLVLVGKCGWNINELVESLAAHSESNRRLFWLCGISDEYLERVYADSACLIAASEGEGFGLPLIEAAQHGLPILARDIPVFREVAGLYAEYFQQDDPQSLAGAIENWIESYKLNNHADSRGMRYKSWDEAAKECLTILLKD